MPQANFVQATLAPIGSAIYPFTGWTYEFLPWPARIKILAHASLAGKIQVFSGSESIMDPSNVQVNTTPGALPADLNVQPIIFDAPAGDRLRVVCTNDTAVATTFSLVVLVQPI